MPEGWRKSTEGLGSGVLLAPGVAAEATHCKHVGRWRRLDCANLPLRATARPAAPKTED